MTERAKHSYEGLDAYEAGYRVGYEAGHNDATTMSQWYWDKNGMDWGIGAWRCEACGYRNTALPSDPSINPYTWAGSRHCANCGRKMIDIREDEE